MVRHNLGTQQQHIILKLYEYTKTHWIVYFKRANFMICEVYLRKLLLKAKMETAALD